MTKSQRESYGIVCPACSYSFDSEDLANNILVTRWGGDPPKEVDCPSCEAKLLISETVKRTFTVRLHVEGD